MRQPADGRTIAAEAGATAAQSLMSPIVRRTAGQVHSQQGNLVSERLRILVIRCAARVVSRSVERAETGDTYRVL
jgi:hypothetical protein